MFAYRRIRRGWALALLLGLVSRDGAQALNREAEAPRPAVVDTGTDKHLRIDPRPNLVGSSVTIAEGTIPLPDFLRFLSDFMGLPLLVDSSDQGLLSREIEIVAPLVNVNGEVIKSLLQTNKVRLYNERLADGTEVLKIDPRVGDPRPIVVVPIGAIEAMRDKINPEQYSTMVFELEHVEPRDAIETLNKLVGATSSRPGGPSVGRDTQFSMVEVKNALKLLITAKFGILNYLRELLELIDVPFYAPERILKTYQIEWANATQIASLIGNLVSGPRGSGGRYGRAGQRPITVARGNGKLPATGMTPGGNSYSTTLHPDERTNKIIVETYSEADLLDFESLLRELDVRYDNRRLRTNVYHVRYLKAVELAQAVRELFMDSSGRRGSAGGTSRIARSTTRASLTARASGPGATEGAPGKGLIPSHVVPYEATNTLLIQAEPEDYEEIMNIVKQIDVKRRQVFLEAVVVQVRSNSNLNYAVELLAGNPSDNGTHALAASGFGTSAIDFSTFDHVSPEASAISGGLVTLMRNGKLPAIISFFKKNSDSQVLATPFIVADDNEPNVMNVLETRYTADTVRDGEFARDSLTPREAGTVLELTPTVSGSGKAVFLTLGLSVSEFLTDGTTPADSLRNSITGAVTAPNGEVFVIGGLTKRLKEKTVEKVPMLGDIPILGKLFRKEAHGDLTDNLYIFLRAQILMDEEFRDGKRITERARESMEKFDAELPRDFDPVQEPKLDGESGTTGKPTSGKGSGGRRKKLRGWFE